MHRQGRAPPVDDQIYVFWHNLLCRQVSLRPCLNTSERLISSWRSISKTNVQNCYTIAFVNLIPGTTWSQGQRVGTGFANKKKHSVREELVVHTVADEVIGI